MKRLINVLWPDTSTRDGAILATNQGLIVVLFEIAKNIYLLLALDGSYGNFASINLFMGVPWIQFVIFAVLGYGLLSMSPRAAVWLCILVQPFSLLENIHSFAHPTSALSIWGIARFLFFLLCCVNCIRGTRAYRKCGFAQGETGEGSRRLSAIVGTIRAGKRSTKVALASAVGLVLLLGVFRFAFQDIFKGAYDPPVPVENEIVMPPNTQITVSGSRGVMTITSGTGLRRSYSWEGATRSVEMRPRKARWNGSMGIYCPGPGNHWQEHNGIRRGVLEEGQQHFDSVEKAMEWIGRHKTEPLIYRDDGLAANWFKVPERQQINVNVWRILIKGRKPEALPGSAKDRIRISVVQAKADIPAIRVWLFQIYDFLEHSLTWVFL